MAKVTVMDILKAKKTSIDEFNFDNLWIPPINCFLSQQDIDRLRSIATSVRLSSRIQEKYRMIDEIMRARGFRRFSAGTNRIVYKFMEDDRFLVKIAVDRVGMKDNPAEYNNQFLLKPFVTKMFYTSTCGTVGFVERVLPIKNKEEFKIIADDVFDMLVTKILGKYVVEDIGTKFFMNYGIRVGFGPVLLDYPYVFKLDGNKLFCGKKLEDGSICNGEIDYNSGFNHLVCDKCGKQYLARDLQEQSTAKIIVSGGTRMKVEIVKGNEILYRSRVSSQDVIRREASEDKPKAKGFSVVITKGDKILVTSEQYPASATEFKPQTQPTITKPKAASTGKKSAARKSRSIIENENKNEIKAKENEDASAEVMNKNVSAEVKAPTEVVNKDASTDSEQKSTEEHSNTKEAVEIAPGDISFINDHYADHNVKEYRAFIPPSPKTDAKSNGSRKKGSKTIIPAQKPADGDNKL